jgi:CRP/FNR family transcriptional regulator, cyclic AMP receptor protein
MRKVLHLMGALSDADVDWLAEQGHVRFVPRETPVIRQGEPVESLFILLEGRLSVRLGGLQGQEVATLHPGEVLGEISFVDARPPSASVVSVEDSHLLLVARDLLTKKMDRDDGFAARFYRGLAVFLADRLRTTTAHLGYGKGSDEDLREADAIADDSFDDISLAARRFDEMLRRLRIAR